MNSADRHQLSRDLGVVLRHSAPLYGLPIREDGCVKVSDLLRLDEFSDVSLEGLQEVVDSCPTQLELINETASNRPEWLIRSTSGHTIPSVCVGTQPAIDVAGMRLETMIYCTTVTNLKRIRRACGVKRQEGCKYIILNRQEPFTRHKSVLLFLDIERALKAKLQFFRVGRNAFACPGNAKGVIPLSYFFKIETREASELSPSSGTLTRNGESSGADGRMQTQLSGRSVRATERGARRWMRAFVSMPQAQSEHYTCGLAANFCWTDASEPGPSTWPPTWDAQDDTTSLCDSDESDDIEIITSTTQNLAGPHKLSPEAPVFFPSAVEVQASTTSSISCLLVPSATLFRYPRNAASSELSDKWLIFPVSIPGCGKTSVCAALAHLFGFAHVQANDVTRNVSDNGGRRSFGRRAQPFLDAVSGHFRINSVVLADRNNHLFHHRSELRAACQWAEVAGGSKPKTIALRWCPGPRSMRAVHTSCMQRILSWRQGQQWFDARPGDTLTRVLWKFLREVQFQPLGMDEVDYVIEMDPLEGLEAAMERVIVSLVDIVGLDIPHPARLLGAIHAARSSLA